MPNVTRLSIFSPRSTRLMLNRLRVNRPAATSNAIDSAIWVVASDVRNRAAALVPVALPDWPFSTAARSGRVEWMAGNRPNSRPVPIVSAAANSSTSESSDS